jgi:phosphopantothenoylcysteine decarboxylase/phosphopantothenate--cysteine ligase
MAEPGDLILLGVSGSIAAFKAADITSHLVQLGFSVQVIMTEAATKLIQPQTFFTLSQRPVITSLWEAPTWEPQHISISERAKLLVIAPATADIIAKLAHGIADDALSTFSISHAGPIIVIPAMNTRMWNNAATQENCETLRRRGIMVVEPAVGKLACGDTGKGRFPDVPVIVDLIAAKMYFGDFRVSPLPRILVTAGPTREAVDPVRFLTNRSTGRQGFAIATAAAALGCPVTLIAGPVELATPLGVDRVNVESAAELKAAVLEELGKVDVLIMTAAVADYRPAEIADQKIHKSGDMALRLERTEDVLLAVKEVKRADQKIVGFSADTENFEESALGKLERKGLDFICSNDVSRPDVGFKSESNELTVYTRDRGIVKLPKDSKWRLSVELLKLILARSTP